MTRFPPLRIFMPVAHGRRALGVAGSLRRIGMTMVVNDETASLGPTTDGRYSAERARDTLGPDVEVVGGEDILARPPDVMIVGRRDHEPAMYELWRRLNEIRPVVFCAYSGVYQAPYTFRRYHGIIATDVATRIVARTHGIPALKFFPDFAFDEYSYVPELPSGRVVLRSYTNHLAKRFPFAHRFHAVCAEALAARFGDRVTVENVQGVSRQRTRELMVESTATLHIKDQEGFGWSVVESLATGRPVISQAGLSRNMAYLEWTGEAARDLVFVTPDGLVRIVERLQDDLDWRARLQREAAETIRQRYDPAAHAEALGEFLTALVTVERHRWRRWGGATSPAVRPYEPTLDPGVLQDYERVILEGRSAADIPDA
jgi:hypothetical protein